MLIISDDYGVDWGRQCTSYKDDREVEDHVYCTFEYPGKNYDAAAPNPRRNDIVVVTYSSISTNGFEKYGKNA